MIRLGAAIAFVVTCGAAAGAQEPSWTSPVALATAAGYDEAETLRACLAESVEDLRAKDIYAEPLTALFLDGRTVPVELTLCVASSIEWRLWYLLDRGAPDPSHAYLDFSDDARPLREVRDLRASPDGKYLAVHYSEEGHPSVTVVDLPRLVRNSAYQPIGDAIDSYPGTVSINSWDDSALRLRSDVLLSHPTDGTSHLPLLSEEAFSWELAAAQLGQLSGIVRDDGGGELPGVTVTASSPTLSETRTTESDGRGQYAVADLASGDYVLRFSLGGAFEDCRVDARITADRRTVVDVVMRLKSMPPREGVPACGKPGQ
jgi:hypothetical protein